MKIVKGTFCKDAACYDEFASGRKSASGENRGRACCGQTRDRDHIPPTRGQEYPQRIDLKINHDNAKSVYDCHILRSRRQRSLCFQAI